MAAIDILKEGSGFFFLPFDSGHSVGQLHKQAFTEHLVYNRARLWEVLKRIKLQGSTGVWGTLGWLSTGFTLHLHFTRSHRAPTGSNHRGSSALSSKG